MEFTNEQLITQLYVGYYNRAPDPEGLRYWIGRYEAGVPLADIADSFAASPEAIATYPELAFDEIENAESFLAQVYQNLFGRAIDADGLAYYSAKLESGEATAGQIIAEIQGNANTNTSAGNNDRAILANKVAVGLNFAVTAEATAGFEYTGDAVQYANTVLDNVDETQASVDAALASNQDFFEGSTDTLTEALEALQGARAAVEAQEGDIADFLEGSISNEFVEAANTTDTNGDGTIDAADVDAGVIDDANEAAAAVLVTESEGSITETAAQFVALTEAQQNARIETTRVDLQAEITDAEEAVETAAEALEAGVTTLVATAQARADALVAAFDAQDAQDVATEEALDAADAVETDGSVNFELGGTVGVVEADDGVAAATAITAVTDGRVSFTSAVTLNANGTSYSLDVDGVAGADTTISKSYLDAVLAAAQADVDAAANVVSAQDALATAVTDVQEAQDPAFDGSAQTYGSLVTDGVIAAVNDANAADTVTLDYSAAGTATGGAAIDTYATELGDLAAAQEDLEEFNEAVADWQATDALVDQLDDLNDELGDLNETVTDAQAAIENDENDDPAGLGVTLLEGADNFTAEDDVYLYAENSNQSLTGFGATGDDKIYFGEGFELVALGDDDIGDNVGDIAASEIFWEQDGNDVVLYVEEEAFGGNSSGTDDVTTIRLVGVDAADVTFEGGFLSSGSVAVA